MKKISEHLGQIIVSVACVAVLISVITVYQAPISGFFSGITNKLTSMGSTVLGGFEIDPDIGVGAGGVTLSGNGQKFYTMAPSTLSFRSTAPLSEFKEVKVNGVTLNPSNYTLTEGSTIITLSIDYLKTLDVAAHEITVVSESGSPSAGFFVVEPGLNSNGFYYNQPYTAYVPAFGNDQAFFIRDNGTFDTIGYFAGGAINSHETIETNSYTVNGNTIQAETSIGTVHCTVSDDGKEIYCIELDTTFKLGDENIMADEDYIYLYDTTYDGYEVFAINSASTVSFSDCLTNVNEKEVIALGSAADYINRNVIEKVVIPEHIQIINYGAFYSCNNVKTIIFEGTVEQWNSIQRSDNWNCYKFIQIETGTDADGEIRYRYEYIPIPATEVKCSDGVVTLPDEYVID